VTSVQFFVKSLFENEHLLSKVKHQVQLAELEFFGMVAGDRQVKRSHIKIARTVVIMCLPSNIGSPARVESAG